uniref:Uncharacterized protein n=2 Tax=Meloidogyne TaxID=189290 RepID=A0A6V7WAJ3_MELEN|nr:unnamed protein product [Meloidogyne enterolobii]
MVNFGVILPSSKSYYRCYMLIIDQAKMIVTLLTVIWICLTKCGKNTKKEIPTITTPFINANKVCGQIIRPTMRPPAPPTNFEEINLEEV